MRLIVTSLVRVPASLRPAAHGGALQGEWGAFLLWRQADGPRGLFGGKSGRRDEGTVFVAGGTGRLGARIVRQLLLQGFK